MAGFDFGPIIGDALGNFALITVVGRSIGGVFPDVTVEEIHRDELIITPHPVETGTPVTDHSFLTNPSVEMRCGWSDSIGGGPGYSVAVYQELLSIMQSRQPFDVTTGKRQYTSMLCNALLVRTNAETENGLGLIAILEHINIVDVQTTGGGNAPNTNGSSVKADPGSPEAKAASDSGFTANSNGSVSTQDGPEGGGTVQPIAAVNAPSVEQVAAAQGVP